MQAGEAKQQFSDANALQKVAANPPEPPKPDTPRVENKSIASSETLVGSLCRRVNLQRYQSQTKGAAAVLPIKGVYEIAIRVKDLARAEAFYKDVLGLTEGIRDDRRNWLFLYVGGNAGMVVLQEDKGEWPTQHFAFAVTENDVNRAAQMLKDKGVAVSEPVYHEWMKSVSVYFDDPDGHALELLALTDS